MRTGQRGNIFTLLEEQAIVVIVTENRLLKAKLLGGLALLPNWKPQIWELTQSLGQQVLETSGTFL
jgi:hypothetical protein